MQSKTIRLQIWLQKQNGKDERAAVEHPIDVLQSVVEFHTVLQHRFSPFRSEMAMVVAVVEFVSPCSDERRRSIASHGPATRDFGFPSLSYKRIGESKFSGWQVPSRLRGIRCSFHSLFSFYSRCRDKSPTRPPRSHSLGDKARYGGALLSALMIMKIIMV